MNNKTNTYTSVGIMIAAAALVAAAVIAVHSCNRQHNEASDAKTILLHQSDTTRHYTDAAGRDHGTKAIATVSEANVSAAYQQEIDSLRKALNIKEKQLESFTMLGTTSTVNVPLQIDTSHAAGDSGSRFHYSSKWIDLNGALGKTPELTYTLHDSLVLSAYWKRSWLLGSKTTYIDAYSLNPAVHISNVTAAQITLREPGRFSLGPYVGYGYNGLRWQPSLGIALQYSLIRF